MSNNGREYFSSIYGHSYFSPLIDKRFIVWKYQRRGFRRWQKLWRMIKKTGDKDNQALKWLVSVKYGFPSFKVSLFI